MVFPTVSYSSKINGKFSSSKKVRTTHPKLGPRHAPNIHDRIAAYDRAFQRCLKQDSKLSSWKKRMDDKGLPAPLIEGYQRSSSSWQHSLSSMSSDSSSSSNDSYTLHGTKNMYDIKPMRSIPVASPFPHPPPPPPPLLPPTPKPSVSRRIINRLSLSKSTKRQSSKVVPTTTQSLQVTVNDNKNKSCDNPYHHHPTSQRQSSVPKSTIPRTGRLPPQKPSHLTQDRHSQQINSRRSYCHQLDMPRLPSPPPSPCRIDDYLSQKMNRGVEHSHYQSSHYYHRH